MEDASLGELSTLLCEVFSATGLPPGTVLALGSASHLFQSGSSCYAGAWVECVSGLQNKWPSLQICPLIPIPNTDLPGKFYRTVVEFSVWLELMYKGKTTGLGDVWKAYTLTLAQHCTGQNQRLTVESYTLPFPCTLSLPVKTRTVAFHCDQSAPSVINTGLAGVEDRLILVLVEVLNRDFSARLHPVSDGQRVAAK
jgi:hypothetical protein